MFTLPQIKKELSRRYKQDIALDILENYIHIWNIEPAIKDKMLYDENSLYKLSRGIKLTNDGFNENAITDIINTRKKENGKTKKTIDEYVYEKVEEAINILREEGNNNDAEKLKSVLKSKNEEKQRKINYQTNPSRPVSKEMPATNVVKLNKEKPHQYISKDTQEDKSTAERPSGEAKEKVSDSVINKLSDKISEKVSFSVVESLLDYFKAEEFLYRLGSFGSLRRDNEILSKQVEELIKANSMLEDKLFELEVKNRNYKRIWKNLYFKMNG
jgi:ribosomal protein S17